MLEPGLEIAEAKKNGYRAEITWHICLEKPMWPLSSGGATHLCSHGVGCLPGDPLRDTPLCAVRDVAAQ
jgi:hypothetical protein